MKLKEFRDWLTARNLTPNSIQSCVNAVQRIEKFMKKMGNNYDNLDDAFAKDGLKQLSNDLFRLRENARNGGQDYTVLISTSKDPAKRLGDFQNWLKKYQIFLREKADNNQEKEGPVLLFDKAGTPYVPVLVENRQTGIKAYRIKSQGGSNSAADSIEEEDILAVARALLVDGRPVRIQPLSGGQTNYLTYGNKLISYQLQKDLAGDLGLPTAGKVEATEIKTNLEEMTMRSTNLILYGPPGTGKTYATAAEAVRLCDGHVPAGRTEVMKRYQELVKSGQVRFITFHQSFSYEDFVEGLRPVQGNDEDETGFSLEPRHGVFRDIATVAELASKSGNRNTERLDLSGRDFYKMSLGRAKYDEHVYQGAIEEEYIVLGWGGEEDWSDARFDDSNEIRKRWKELGDEIDGGNNPISQLDRFRNQMQIGDIIVVSKGNHYFRAIGEITGPYYFEMAEDGIYNHRRSVRWLSVLDTELPVEAILEVKFSQQSCYSLNQKKLKLEALSRLIPGEDTGESGSAPDQFVLIIDEINRANISKVFGELITLLEPDKRLGEDGEIKLTLPYSGTSFGVPSNLHIIGTMNTADRSIALLDTALRRRFIFRELMPDPALLKEASVASKVDLVNFLMRINDRIEYLFDREHQIGHAYFMKCTSRVALDEVMRDKIIPLLAEYFYEDWGKLALVLGDTGKGDKFLQRTELKSPFPDTDDFSEPRFRWQVLEQFGPNAYKVV